MVAYPKPVLWTDLELLDILLSDSPEDVIQLASDILVSRYHDSLLERALFLYGGDEFLASETIWRTFDAAAKNISSADTALLYWLLQVLEKQFRIDTNQVDSNDDFSDDNFSDDDFSDDNFADSYRSEWDSEPTDSRSYLIPDDGIEDLMPTHELLSRRLPSTHIIDDESFTT